MNRLHRSQNNKMIAGVAGGMAEFFDVDVALVRLVWVLVCLAGGAGVLIYIACWLIIPVYPENEEYTENTVYPRTETEATYNESGYKEDRGRRHRNAGLLLIGVGIVFLAGQWLPHWIVDKSWPLFLVLIGLYLLFRERKEETP